MATTTINGAAPTVGQAASLREAMGAANDRLVRILRAAERAKVSNPRTAGLAPSPPTITDNGATLPSSTPQGFLCNTTSRGVWHVVGGQLRGSGGGPKSVQVDATQALATVSRFSAVATSRYVALRLVPSTAPYRIMVDDKYISMTGTTLGVTTGSVSQYLLLDFTTRAMRKITVECQQNASSCVGAYVEATGTMSAIDTRSRVAGAFLGDSFVQGTLSVPSGDYNRADGVAIQLGDYLGIDMLASGSGGTGWNQTSTTVYRFDERIANGDLGLGYSPLDIIFLMASVNDRNRDSAVVQANALAGLQAARLLYPKLPIVVFGCARIPLGPFTGSPSLAATETAVQSAVSAIADPLTAFVPMIGDTVAPWLTGTGDTGAPNSTGSCDWAIGPDRTHLSPEGVPYLAQRWAAATLTSVSAMLA